MRISLVLWVKAINQDKRWLAVLFTVSMHFLLLILLQQNISLLVKLFGMKNMLFHPAAPYH